MQDFSKKVVVITGAGSGIGRELAKQFAARGSTLALSDFNGVGLNETWEMLPETSRGHRAVFDVSDREAMYAFAAATRQLLGRVDVVINNAGMSVRQMPVVHSRVEDYEKVLGVNLWGVIYGTLAFLPHLRENIRGPEPEAALVNISSVFGLFAFPGAAPYNVSKFGVRGFTETMRLEMKGTGLLVSCVHPGGIATNIHKNVEIEDRRERERFIQNFEKQAKTTASEAARVIIKGIERNKARILIGSDARFIDKVTRLLPASYERILARWLDPKKFLGRQV